MVRVFSPVARNINSRVLSEIKGSADTVAASVNKMIRQEKDRKKIAQKTPFKKTVGPHGAWIRKASMTMFFEKKDQIFSFNKINESYRVMLYTRKRVERKGKGRGHHLMFCQEKVYLFL